jgi:hypothetical protein
VFLFGAAGLVFLGLNSYTADNSGQAYPIDQPTQAASSIPRQTSVPPERRTLKELQLAALVKALRTPAEPPEPIPPEFRSEMPDTATSSQDVHTVTVTTDKAHPGIVVTTSNPDFCGSGGCSLDVYGFDNGSYKLWVEDHGWTVKTTDHSYNGHKDVLIYAGTAASRFLTLYAFDGRAYKPDQCFSYDESEGRLEDRRCNLAGTDR